MKNYIEIMKQLRGTLHTCPEIAFHEKKTKHTIKQFLESLHHLTVVDRDRWLYVKKEGSGDGKKIAFRADFDAVSGGDGQPGHFCGHDGHSAVLCGLAKYLDEYPVKETVYLIFQPAEEIGEGARLCRELIAEEGIEEIYGFHNIPGYPKGELLLKEGTFACASTGLEMRFQGTPSHAAYPEAGRNPSILIAKLILWMNQYIKQEEKTSKGLLLGTVIGAELGSDAYGVSASQGILRLTIRGEIQSEFERFLYELKHKAEELGHQQEIQVQIEEIERFPATENHNEQVLELERKAKAAGISIRKLATPFRWSEDFGYYLMETKGCMFGIGAGEEHPQLHTVNYEFPDEILEDAMRAFLSIIA